MSTTKWDEELLRTPRKGDALIPAPTPLDRYEGNPADACALGYRMAAQALVEHIRHYGHETFLFYPIMFLYRHHVELMLKNLILAFDQPEVRRITQAEELNEAGRQSLVNGKKAHSLQWLWERLRPVVQTLGKNVVPPEKIEGIDFYIQQLNETDPYSVSFRYATGLEETKSTLEKAQKKGAEVDLRTFAEAMERLANYLYGLDNYVAAIIECHHDMLADFNDSSY